MMKVFGNLLFKKYNLIFSFIDSIKIKNKSYKYYNMVFKFLKLKKTLNFQIKSKEIK